MIGRRTWASDAEREAWQTDNIGDHAITLGDHETRITAVEAGGGAQWMTFSHASVYEVTLTTSYQDILEGPVGTPDENDTDPWDWVYSLSFSLHGYVTAYFDVSAPGANTIDVRTGWRTEPVGGGAVVETVFGQITLDEARGPWTFEAPLTLLSPAGRRAWFFAQARKSGGASTDIVHASVLNPTYETGTCLRLMVLPDRAQP